MPVTEMNDSSYQNPLQLISLDSLTNGGNRGTTNLNLEQMVLSLKSGFLMKNAQKASSLRLVVLDYNGSSVFTSFSLLKVPRVTRMQFCYLMSQELRYIRFHKETFLNSLTIWQKAIRYYTRLIHHL